MTFRTGPGVLTGYDAGVMDLRMSGGPFFEDFSDDKFLRGEDAPVNEHGLEILEDVEGYVENLRSEYEA